MCRVNNVLLTYIWDSTTSLLTTNKSVNVIVVAVKQYKLCIQSNNRVIHTE